MPSAFADRQEFLRALYSAYWSNMARSMEGIWQILGPITVAGTAIGAVHGNFVQAQFGISCALLITLWGVNITIDLNAWHRRNLFFLAKVERELLSADDYGKLLPASYKTPQGGWITFYSINLGVFLAFAVLVMLYAASKLTPHDCLIPSLVGGLGAVLTVNNAFNQEVSAARHFAELYDRSKGA